MKRFEIIKFPDNEKPRSKLLFSSNGNCIYKVWEPLDKNWVKIVYKVIDSEGRCLGSYMTGKDALITVNALATITDRQKNGFLR